jgi:hypothetical protein
MPLDPSIALSARGPQIQSPLEQLAHLLQFKQAQQQLQTGQQEQQIRQTQLDAARQRQSDIAAMDQALGDNRLTQDQVLKSVPGHLVPDVQKYYDDANKRAEELDKAQRDYYGALAYGVKKQGGSLFGAAAAIQHAMNNGHPEAMQMWDQIKNNPDELSGWLDGMVARSPTYAKIDEDDRLKTSDEARKAAEEARKVAKAPAEQAKAEADALRAQQVTSGQVPITPEQTQAHRDRAAQLALERERLNRQHPTGPAGQRVDAQAEIAKRTQQQRNDAIEAAKYNQTRAIERQFDAKRDINGHLSETDAALRNDRMALVQEEYETRKKILAGGGEVQIPESQLSAETKTPAGGPPSKTPAPASSQTPLVSAIAALKAYDDLKGK